MCWPISHKHLDRELCMGTESLTNVSKGDCHCCLEKKKKSSFLLIFSTHDTYLISMISRVLIFISCLELVEILILSKEIPNLLILLSGPSE